MHEISLVRNIFNTLEQQFSTEELGRIMSIRLKVGVLSNVQPLLMQNAFDAVTATDAPQFKNTRLLIEVLPVVVHCDACNHDTQIENYRFMCERCGQPNSNVIQGAELMISGVTFEDKVFNAAKPA